MPLSDEESREIASLAAGQAGWMTDLRRRLHQVPEPAFEERRTSDLLAEVLTSLGFALRRGVGGTGIVADLECGGGPCVAFRADMDALAVPEATGAAYSSRHEGYSHCCGHDGNMATALGAARVVAELGDRFAGRLRLVLQPAEEAGNGAEAMIAGGALADPAPRAILAIHGWPMLPVGVLACRAGVMMASCDGLGVRIVGRGGHGARPERANSPLPGMARVIEALAGMNTPSRVVSLCIARAGRVSNVIPDEAELSGTLRAVGEDVRRCSTDEVVAAVAAACEPLGLRPQVTWREGTPAVVIPEELYGLFRRTAGAMVGPGRVVEMTEPIMGSEDFACYLQRCPGLMFRVGVGVDRAPLHNAAFDFNDDALAPAASVLAAMAVALAREPAGEAC